MEKVIGNAVDEMDEEFVVLGKSHNIRIAVTDNDWEYPIDEDDEEDSKDIEKVKKRSKSKTTRGLKYSAPEDSEEKIE